MRLRLVHTLSLTLLAFAVTAVLALGGLTAWNLRKGFGDYVAARDVAHFERFVGVLEATLARGGGLQDLRDGAIDMRAVLNELNGRPAGPPGPPGVSGGPPPRPPGGPDAFHLRVQVLDLDGRLLLGSPRGPSGRPAGPAVERPVRLQGQTVATARLRPAALLPEGSEARFLHDQYRVLAVSAIGLIVLALLTAALLARRWTRPLAAVQGATQRLARGELDVRVPEGGGLADRTDEIGDVVRNVNRMAEGLQRLEGARRRWLADISHELRTPLTVLRGDIEALVDGVRPLRPEAIGVLHEEVLRLGKLVDDLHLLATSDLQTLPCHMAPADAVALMQRLLRRFEPRAQAAGLDLALVLPPGMARLQVTWDADRIEQLLSNLLENSLRYTDAPGRVQLRLQADGGTVRVWVDDSAPGVPEAHLAQLFEPLYRGDAARARHNGGSGLGLAICEAIARAHDGQLSASASALGGLCISLTLPLNAKVHIPVQTATPQSAGGVA
jgi:two-component system, OmpR family, sensor histidine kinase BaeS